MYKTVKQGDNCLQYTILPQTEEVLMKNGIKGRGRDYSPSIQVRRRPKAPICFYIMMFIFGCLVTVIVAAIPIFILSRILMDPSMHVRPIFDMQAGAIIHPTPSHVNKNVAKKKELSLSTEAAHESTVTTQAYTTTNGLIPMKQIWALPVFKAFRNASTEKPLPTSQPTVEDPLERNLPPFEKTREIYKYEVITSKPLKNRITKPTPVTGKAVLSTVLNGQAMSTDGMPIRKNTVPKSFYDLLTTLDNNAEVEETTTIGHKKQFRMEKFEDLKNSILTMDDDYVFKNSLEIEEGVPVVNGIDDVKVSQIRPKQRWPFVDSSSYFQWSGYTARDNLLLPTITAAAAAALCCFAIVAYRRKRTSRRQQNNIGKLTSDLQPDDNTNLLIPEEDE